MKLNKCERCGCFFVSTDSICPNCVEKDNNEISQLTSFLSENDSDISIEELAESTGVSLKNVNRFLQNDTLSTKFSNLGLITGSIGSNISINL